MTSNIQIPHTQIQNGSTLAQCIIDNAHTLADEVMYGLQGGQKDDVTTAYRLFFDEFKRTFLGQLNKWDDTIHDPSYIYYFRIDDPKVVSIGSGGREGRQSVKRSAGTDEDQQRELRASSNYDGLTALEDNDLEYNNNNLDSQHSRCIGGINALNLERASMLSDRALASKRQKLDSLPSEPELAPQLESKLCARAVCTNQVWEVRRIVGKEVVDDVLHYRVRWVDTLEPEHSLEDAKELVRRFEARLSAETKKGRRDQV